MLFRSLSNPALPAATRETLVGELMAARREVALQRRAGSADGLREARTRVDGAKRARYEGVEDVRFSGRPGSLTYLGGPGRDRLSVSGGMQVKAYGRRGADILVGGSRNDLLVGGPGRDQLVGGSGRDRCIGGEQRRQCEVHR